MSARSPLSMDSITCFETNAGGSPLAGATYLGRIGGRLAGETEERTASGCACEGEVPAAVPAAGCEVHSAAAPLADAGIAGRACECITAGASRVCAETEKAGFGSEPVASITAMCAPARAGQHRRVGARKGCRADAISVRPVPHARIAALRECSAWRTSEVTDARRSRDLGAPGRASPSASRGRCRAGVRTGASRCGAGGSSFL